MVQPCNLMKIVFVIHNLKTYKVYKSVYFQKGDFTRNLFNIVRFCLFVCLFVCFVFVFWFFANKCLLENTKNCCCWCFLFLFGLFCFDQNLTRGNNILQKFAKAKKSLLNFIFFLISNIFFNFHPNYEATTIFKSIILLHHSYSLLVNGIPVLNSLHRIISSSDP